MSSSTTLYQSAILQDDNRMPSTSTSVCKTDLCEKTNKHDSNLCDSQPNATSHVKYTSAQPFTPKFIKDHLTRDTKSDTTTTITRKRKLPSYRAQALYDERVHRRQLGLVRRIQSQSQRTKREKEKRKGVKREKMGRREAAEMGVWRLRKEEARCACPDVHIHMFLSNWVFFWFFRWDAFVPLHRLWLGYMSELLGLMTTSVDTLGLGQELTMPLAAGMHAKLVKADFHGSIMTGSVLFFFFFWEGGFFDGITIQRAEAEMRRWLVCLVSLCKRRRIRSRS